MELCFSSCENSIVEQERPGTHEDAIRDIACGNTNNVPNYSSRMFIGILKVHKDQAAAFNQGYRIYDVQNVQPILLTADNYSTYHHQSITQKTDQIFVIAYKTTGIIHYATCSCTAREVRSHNDKATPSFAYNHMSLPIPLLPTLIYISSLNMECT